MTILKHGRVKKRGLTAFFYKKKFFFSDINCWNPAFDITPNSLITAFIMENGVFWNDKDKKPTFIF